MNTHQKIKEQRIRLREFGDRVGSLSKIKALGFAKEEGNKIFSCDCFQADPDLGIKIAAQRFFFNGSGCKQKLQLPVKVRYLGIGSECQYWSIMTRGGDQGWNSYTILSFETAKGYVEEDHYEIVSLTGDA